MQWGYEKRAGGVSFLGAAGGWPQMATKYEIDTVSYVNTLLHTFNNTTFSEFTIGVNWSHQYTTPFDDAALASNQVSQVLPGFKQFFPNANPLNLLPQASFTGGVSGTIPSFGYEQRFGFFGYNAPFTISGNLTKLKGAHNLKTGLFVERTTRPAQRSSSFNGNLSFNTDGSNPLNTNIGYANALLGAVTQYQESNAHPSAHGLFMNTEFFAQDNWRVKRKFTVDAGVTLLRDHTDAKPRRPDGAVRARIKWSAAAAPQLYQPAISNGTRVAVDPITHQTYPLVYLNRLVPNSGDFYNGMVIYDDTPQKKTPFKVAPRLGFAWDVTGDGKTAVRAGAGVFYDRYADDNILDLIELPPLLLTYTTNYTTIPELLSSPLTATTTAVRRITNFIPPVVYNWSAGVQRDIGWRLVADAAYVGNSARNQLVNRPINGQGYGYAYQPSSLDSTNVIGGITQPLPNDYLRPYRGYGAITQREFTGYGDFHSLQFSVNRRRSSDGLSVGAAYTLPALQQESDDDRPVLSGGHRAALLQPERKREYRSTSSRAGHQLLVRNTESQPQVQQHPDQGDFRQLADLRYHDDYQRHLSGAELQLLQRADRRPLGHGRHRHAGQPSGHRLRPEPVARRPHVRAAVQRRLHQAAVRPIQTGELDRRRIPRTGVLERRPLGVQEHPDGRHQAAATPLRGLQRVQQQPVDRHEHHGQLRLRDRCADQRHHRGTVERPDQQRTAHPGRRAVYFLI